MVLAGENKYNLSTRSFWSIVWWTPHEPWLRLYLWDSAYILFCILCLLKFIWHYRNCVVGCHQHNPASMLLRRSKPRAVAQQPHLESKTWRKHVSTPVSDKIVFLRSVRQHHFILPLFKLILSLSLRPSFVLVLNFLKLFNILFFSIQWSFDGIIIVVHVVSSNH